MRLGFEGKRAVVTGGANGIGRAAAEALARSGAAVTVFDLENEMPEAVAESFGARGLAADVTSAESLRAAFAEAGPPDVLVVNAGLGLLAPLEKTSPELWRRILDVNLTGAFLTLREGARLMKARRRGAIVLTASTNSWDGEPDLAAYNASKAGLLGLVRTAANELGPWRIRVNAVCPGLIRTRQTAAHFGDEALLKSYFREIPLGRGGEPEEVASAIVFLASEQASYITGTTLVVDGGQMASKFGPWREPAARYARDHWEILEP